MSKTTTNLFYLRIKLEDYLIDHYRRKLKWQLHKQHIGNNYLAIAITDCDRIIVANCASKEVHIHLEFNQNDNIIIQCVVPCPTTDQHVLSNNDFAACGILAQLADSVRIGELIKLLPILSEDDGFYAQDLKKSLNTYLLKNWLVILQDFNDWDLRMLLGQFTKYLVDHWSELEPDLKTNKNQSLQYLLQFYTKCSAPPKDHYLKVLVGNLYQAAFICLQDHFTDYNVSSNRKITDLINSLLILNRTYGNGVNESTKKQVTLTFPINYFVYIINNEDLLSNGAKINFVITSKEALGNFIDELCVQLGTEDSKLMIKFRFDLISKINRVNISFSYQQHDEEIMTYINLFYQIKQADYQTIYLMLTYLFPDLVERMV